MEQKKTSAELHRRINELLPSDDTDRTLELIHLIGELRIVAHREGMDDGENIYKVRVHK
jgi:hypothetical protein